MTVLKASLLGVTTAIALSSNLAPVLAQAVVNGDFNTGSFTPGWETLGTTSIEDSSFGIAPPSGMTYHALMQTDQGTTGASAAALESFLGLAPNSLSSQGVTEGSAIRQTLFVNAGDTLSFDWNFLTDQYPGSVDNNDFAFFTLGGTLITLADTFTPSVPSLFSPFARETQYTSFTYTAPSTGGYTLGFGVVDVGDSAVNSGLLVTNVVNTPVPEPLTLFGSLAALGFLAKARRQGDRPLQD